MISCGAAIHAYGLGGADGIRERVFKWKRVWLKVVSEGCWTGAMKIFRSMKFRRLQPDATTFNEALAACERGALHRDVL